MLDNMAGGNDAPFVTSEQHDASQINWVAGMSDPGEMIACGAYQELRRMDGEQDAEYAARLTVLIANLPPAHREKIEAAGRKAAQGRANLDTSNGRVNVVVAGKAAWHRLGVNVSRAMNRFEMIELAGQKWRVVKVPTSHQWNGETINHDDTFALVRDDTGAKLATVGSKYEPIQNADAAEFLDEVRGEFGAHYATAGSLHGGKKTWIQMLLPGASFEVARGDKVHAYGTFINFHGGGAGLCFPTANRIECDNTARIACKEASDRALRIRHTGDIRSKLADARRALNITIQAAHEFEAQANTMVRTKLHQPREYFDGLLDAVLDVTAAEAKKGAAALAAADVLEAALSSYEAQAKFRETREKFHAREIKERSIRLEDLVDRFESRSNCIAGMDGTAWAGFNAATEQANHATFGRKIGTQEAQASRRFDSVMDGEANAFNQVALTHALALAN